MTKTTLTACALFLSGALFAQAIHELKTDLLLPVSIGMDIAYEYIPEGKMGAEFDLRYHWNVEVNGEKPGQDFSTPLDLRILTVLVAGKWYGRKAYNGSRYYGGVYARRDWLLIKASILAEYTYLYIYEDFVSYEYQIKRRDLRTALGLLTGYKWILGRHWMLEASLAADVNPFSENNWNYLELDLHVIASLKAGYRF